MISPYFNQNDIFVTYFDLLNEKIRKEEDINKISNEEIWKHLYIDSEYDDTRFRKLVSDFYKLFDAYITQRELESENSQTLYLKLKAYKNRNLSELYPSAIQQVANSKKVIFDKGAEYYLNLYNIEKTLLSFKNEGNLRNKNLDLAKELNLSEISLNVDVFYIAEKLKYYCSFLSWKRSFKLDQKIAGIEFILKLAKTDLFKSYPPISIYYTIVLTLTEEGNLDHYFRLKSLIDMYIHLFSKEEAKEIFDAAISYAVTKGNKGQSEFEQESFELYKTALTRNVLILEDKISSTTFRNIVALGLKLSEFEWVEAFIEQYSKNLPEADRENNVSFSQARLEWYRKNWGKLIVLLSSVEYKEVFQALLSRTLLLLSYYELAEFDSLESLLISFRSYLDRETSYNKDRKMPYYNLIQFVKRLTKLQPKDRLKIQKLKEDVKSTEGIVNKAWLIEKIDELAAGRKR